MSFTHLVALGGNLPEGRLSSLKLLQSVVATLRDRHGTDVNLSQWYRTPAYPAGSGPDFVNAAATVRSDLKPSDFLASLHEIEADFGRVRKHRWAPRTVDLDLIGTDALVLPDRATWQHWHDLPAERQSAEWPDNLILPHPRLQDRGFVLVPLMDVAPDWRHPVLGLSVTQMHANLTPADLAGIERLEDSGCQ